MSTSITKRCILLLERCKNLKQLKQSHAQVLTCGLGGNNFALSRLLALCSSDPVYGFQIFQRIEKPTVCISNTMMKTFLLSGDLIKTLQIYNLMLRDGMYPDNYTLPYLLKACANMKSFLLGEAVHAHCLKLGFSFDDFVGNSLISMYSAFDDMKAARSVFDEVNCKSVVSWTVLISGYAKTGDVDSARLVFDEVTVRKDIGIWGSMISGYVQNNCFKEGLEMFRLMQLTELEPDEAIFVSVLCACAHLGALDIGIWVHRYLDNVRMRYSVRLGTALIDFYAKCGRLKHAEKVFYEMPHRDTICWNAMISGWAMNGDGERALQLFSEMEMARIKPDDITFISVFTACSYSGMALEGLRVLNCMCNVYNMEPKSEHYSCIIDFLGRAGLLPEAMNVIERIPKSSSSSEAVGWRALMNACCDIGNITLAEVAAERLVQLEHHSGAYVLLSNLYASTGKHDGARKIRKMMKNRGINKTPGCSSLEVNGTVHEFIAGEKDHPQMEDLHCLMETLITHSSDLVSA